METQIINNFGIKTEVPATLMRYVLYARKSTEDSSEKQALSIDSQVKEMLAIAEREGLDIIDIRREAHSAKDSGQRPIFNEILRDIRAGRYNGIATWSPDRLSRCGGDLGSLVDLMDEKHLVQIRTYGQTFTNTPSEKFLLMILCSQAKLENDQKSINVKRGLKTRVEMGLWPAPAPTGYLKEKRMDRKCETLIDPDRGHIIKQMFEKVAYEKWSGRKIYNWLKFDLNFKTAGGNKNLTLSNVYVILQNHFYYGVFEYPKNSGNWYKGKHEPLITKELFDLVQTQLKGNVLKTRQEKDFAFTRVIKCGLCGSGITADEKHKKLRNGGVNTHVYYGCTKARDRNCKCGYINETDLIRQLQRLIDQINLNELSIKKQIEAEVLRYKKFQRSLLGKATDIQVSYIDVKNYVKFILKDGALDERRQIMDCFKTSILLREKQIFLEKSELVTL
jgi:DNA invertase Pin-like site-specific DNA recombinase